MTRLPSMLKRYKLRQMDFELAMWQMIWLVVSPRRVYRNIYFHKQTKNQWARDDPAFAVLLVCIISLMAVLYGVANSVTIGGIFRLILYMVIVDFFVIGFAISTIGWFLSNHFLKANSMVQSVDQSVEWAYAFDVHCNGFVPIVLLTYAVQFCLMPVLLTESWISRFLGNTLYLAAYLYYNYVTFLGYGALPFLENTVLILYPSVLFICLYIISLFTGNISKTVLEFYFSTS